MRNKNPRGFMGRRVLLTSLDPLPRLFRAAPGVFAMNHREAAAIARGDGATFKELVAIVQAEDAAEVHRVGKPLAWRPSKRKIRPSGRLYMLNAIYRGRNA